MKRRYLKTGTVILIIFAAAVVCVAAIIFFIYRSGLRYMRTEDTDIKYFGRVDANGIITDGRIWFEDTVASVKLQKHFILEINDSRLTSLLDFREFSQTDDVLRIIDENIPDDMRGGFLMDNFVFNSRGSSIFLHRDSIGTVIRNHERERNNLVSGEIYTTDGKVWTLVSSKANPASYNDFDVIPDSDRTKIYRGNVISFLDNAFIYFASFSLSDGNVINLYPAHNIYRIEYERGVYSGDLYIGAVTNNLKKHGRGLYFYTTGNIYFGDFYNDEKSGVCMILFDNGDIYSGGVVGGIKEGIGTFKWNDGSEYSGGFTDNIKNGYGIYVFEDGTVYDGEWLNGVKHGTGRLAFATGDIYEGEFEDDIFKGQGRYTWDSGEYYEGSFMYNAIHGWGAYQWTSGRRYEGWFDGGEMVLEPPEDVVH